MKLKTAGKKLVEAIRQSSVIRKSLLSDMKEGILYFIRKKDLRATAGIIFSLWSALGAVYVVIIVFVQKTLGSATQDLGLLIMFLGLGLFCGSLAYGHVGHKLSQYKIIFASLIISGIMVIAFALGITQYPNFTVAALLSLLLGTAISPIMIASNTIVHKVSENHMLGKTFSSLEIVIHLGFLVFMFVSSLVAEHIHPLYILVFVGCAVAILGTIQLLRNHRIPWLD
jgi:predicted MFS family arabinose efflux permease